MYQRFDATGGRQHRKIKGHKTRRGGRQITMTKIV
jgi:hypothetical protein